MVPTVLQDGPYALFFFSSDRVESVHIHVKRDRQIAKYWLDPVALAKNRGFPDHELNQIERLVEKHRVTLTGPGMTTLVLEADPAAVDVQIDDDNVVVRLADGRGLSVPLEWYPRLLHATPDERNNWHLLGNGYAIEWPDLDEHIGIEGLLAGRRSGESAKSLQEWLRSRT